MKLYLGMWVGTLAGLAAVWYGYGLVPALWGAGMFASGFVTNKHRAYLREAAKLPQAYLGQKRKLWWRA